MKRGAQKRYIHTVGASPTTPPKKDYERYLKNRVPNTAFSGGEVQILSIKNCLTRRVVMHVIPIDRPVQGEDFKYLV